MFPQTRQSLPGGSSFSSPRPHAAHQEEVASATSNAPPSARAAIPVGPTSNIRPGTGNKAPPTTNQSGTQGKDNTTKQTRGEPPAVRTSFATSGRGGGAFRPIGETFDLNPANGTFSLSLPIPTPSSRAGFGPQLSLSYSSGNGNGLFGFGWGLSVPAITRNTSRGIPRYDATDVYALSGGDDLVPVAAGSRTGNGFSVQRYRPRVENEPSVIERWTNENDPNDVHWRVITADNATSIYGMDDNSRLLDRDYRSPRIFSWLICRSYDADGNAIDYSYKAEDGEGIRGEDGIMPCWEIGRSASVRSRQRYIKSIRYGNRTPCRDLDSWECSASSWPREWLFETTFDYGEHDIKQPTPSDKGQWTLRRDVFSSRSSGFELRTYRLCRRILMFHHFPGRADGLVSSTVFKYLETDAATFLSSVSILGHTMTSEGTYITESLPPFSFEYSTLPQPETLKCLTANTTNLYNLPTPLAKSAEWIDLDGEGLPGLLTRLEDGTMSYQRNKNALRRSGDDASDFAPLRVLDSHPNVSDGPQYYFEDLDRNGKQDLVCLDSQGQLHGYYERLDVADDINGWSTFIPFTSIPNVNLMSDDIIRMDLTGDGLLDLLHAETGPEDVIWQASLAQEGVGPQTRTPCATLESVSLRVKSNGTTRIYTSDMTGDGLSDMVAISNTIVSYWPNMGYGLFGEEVIMSNAPVMDSEDQFNHARVRLMDMDGTGTTDVLYLLPGGGLNIYHNLAGNKWSEPIFVAAAPAIDSISSMVTLDLFGTGMSCLCWTSTDTTAGMPTLKYLDFMAGQKPHMLTGYTNGLGLSVGIEYRPSTAFYLEDEARSLRWETRLPFPVQCVSKVTKRDGIRRTTTTSVFAYHDGYYDGREQEFRGFGMVEEWKTEEVCVGRDQFVGKAPVHTKTWFSNGSQAGLSFPTQTFQGPQKLVNSLPSATAASHRHEMHCALHGRMLRAEVYGDDGTEKASMPYTVDEYSYEVHQIQVPREYGTGIFRVLSKETLSSNYERISGDPRVQHDLVLQTNDFGDPEKSVSVSYGRAQTPPDAVLPVVDNMRSVDITLYGAVDRKKQTDVIMTYSELDYTNHIDENHVFRKPLVWAQREHRILGLETPGLFTIEQLRSLGIEQLPITTSAAVHKVLTSETKTFFRTEDLAGRLPGGKLEPYSLKDQTFQLAMTTDQAKAYLDNVPEPRQGQTSEGGIVYGGYSDLYADGRLWARGPRYMFTRRGSSASELGEARRTFCIPTVTEDRNGHQTVLKLDDYSLLPVESEDAVGNRVAFENDYQRLQPIQITDVNGNRQEAACDAFGNVISTAVMGKAIEEIGDELDESTRAAAQAEDIDSLLADPSGKTAKRLLGNAASRTIFALDQYHRSNSTIGPLNNPTPATIVEITRDRSFRESGNPTILVSISYLDGRGEVVQSVELADAEDGGTQWRFESYEARDWASVSLRTFQPFYAKSHTFIPVTDIDTPYTTAICDPLGRVIGTIRADHTWSKTQFTAWSEVVFDFGDTILVEDPGNDPDIGFALSSLSTSAYLPTWLQNQLQSTSHDQRAAQKSKVYDNTPSIVHYDAAGRPILSIEDGGSEKKYTSRIEYDLAGNTIAAYDSLNRLAESAEYNMMGHCTYRVTMDGGKSWIQTDSIGNPLLEWNSRGVRSRREYDMLDREVSLRLAEPGEEVAKLVTEIEYGDQAESPERGNLSGQIWRVRDQAGLVTNASFDIRGNCTQSALQLAQDYKRTLDWSDGSVALQDLPPHAHHRKFDSLSAIVWEKDAMGNQRRYEHTRSGKSRRVYLAGASSQSEPEPGERWTTFVSNTTYSADGLRLRIDHGNQTSTSFEYDPSMRYLVRERTVRSSRTTLQDLVNTYDCAGRRIYSEDVSRQTDFFNNCQIRPVWEYTYDAVGQLVEARGREQLDNRDGKSVLLPHTAQSQSRGAADLGDGSAMCAYKESYQYDLAGNILSLRHKASENTDISGWTREYFYEELSCIEPDRRSNRLSRTAVGELTDRLGYDDGAGRLGCVTSMTPGYSSLRWDFNQLLRSSATQRVTRGLPETTYYVYNSAGMRVRKVTESAADSEDATRKLKETIYLPGVDVYTKYKGDGATASTHLVTAHIMAGEERVALSEANMLKTGKSLTRYQLGKSAELDDQGQLISYEEYSPFGACTYVSRGKAITAPREYRFSKYLRDSETGLDYCNARYYASWLGRWMSADPMGTVDGPNLYRYSRNDPIQFSDADGTCPKEKEEKAPKSYKHRARSLVPVKNAESAAKSDKPMAPTSTNLAGTGDVLNHSEAPDNPNALPKLNHTTDGEIKASRQYRKKLRQKRDIDKYQIDHELSKMKGSAAPKFVQGVIDALNYKKGPYDLGKGLKQSQREDVARVGQSALDFSQMSKHLSTKEQLTEAIELRKALGDVIHGGRTTDANGQPGLRNTFQALDKRAGYTKDMIKAEQALHSGVKATNALMRNLNATRNDIKMLNSVIRSRSALR